MNSGAYQLIIIVRKDIRQKIGALGVCSFPRGYYVYTGSAMRNLDKRIERYRRKDKKLHWHIDYLLDNEHVKIIDVEIYPSAKREECHYNKITLGMPGAKIPVPGFGSSDCRECPAHLIKLPEPTAM